jgi:hypothetical protein
MTTQRELLWKLRKKWGRLPICNECRRTIHYAEIKMPDGRSYCGYVCKLRDEGAIPVDMPSTILIA